MDNQITLTEVRKAMVKAKNGKSPGVDNISVDFIRNENMTIILCKLFNACFRSGKVPGIWSKGIINPIPKSSTSDPRDPLQYRGITLAPAIYKLYCSVLNDRLVTWFEEQDVLNDEQNGFRKGRSTIDHVQSLTTIIETRKLRKLSTFCAFIDFKKAYDSIDRTILWSKLTSVGISPAMLSALKSIYSDVQSCVRLNGQCSSFFSVHAGLKQGCVLSPLLFNMFIDDFVSKVKALELGIQLDDERVGIMLYADDIVLLAESEVDLQRLLDVLSSWCQLNNLHVNLEKSNVVHFRSQSMQVTDIKFRYGTNEMSIVTQYKYLGLLLTEFLDYNVMAKMVAQSASRALGLLIAKCKAFGGFHYTTFTKLYDTLVNSIIDYGSAIWGTKEVSCISAVQNRACRFFMGLGKYAPNLAVNGDMGWKAPVVKQWECVFRQWNRYALMENSRLNRKIMQWSFSCAKNRSKNWVSRVCTESGKLGIHDFSHDNDVQYVFDMREVKQTLASSFFEHWGRRLFTDTARSGSNKLRTYRKFKLSYGPEPYLFQNLPISHRSALAKFRSGTAPIRIETGRYENIPLDNRSCFHCLNMNISVIESEVHVLTECALYEDLRRDLYVKAQAVIPNFLASTSEEKLFILLQNENLIRLSAKTCCDILKRRRNILYS